MDATLLAYPRVFLSNLLDLLIEEEQKLLDRAARTDLNKITSDYDRRAVPGAVKQLESYQRVLRFMKRGFLFYKEDEIVTLTQASVAALDQPNIYNQLIYLLDQAGPEDPGTFEREDKK